jgi:hypothetical protein
MQMPSRSDEKQAGGFAQASAPPKAQPSSERVDSDDARQDAPETGFWRAGLGATLGQSLRSAAFTHLNAVMLGCIIAAAFMYHVVFRLRMSTIFRLLFLFCSPFYFPVVALLNSIVLTTLEAVRRNLNRLEETLSKLTDAIVSPVLQYLPSFSRAMSFDELRSRLLASAKVVRHTEAPVSHLSVVGVLTSPLTLSSRIILNAAIRAILFAVEARYGSALRAGERKLSIATVRRILSGELVAFLLSPFSATINTYMFLAAAELTALTAMPFVLANLLSR